MKVKEIVFNWTGGLQTDGPGADVVPIEELDRLNGQGMWDLASDGWMSVKLVMTDGSFIDVDSHYDPVYVDDMRAWADHVLQQFEGRS